MRASSLLAICAAILGLAPSVGAAPNVELLYVVDTGNSAVRASRARVSDIYTDLIDNLPAAAKVRVRPFRPTSRGLEPWNPADDDELARDRTAGNPPASVPVLQRALAAGESLLCPEAPGQQAAAKFIVLIGTSPPGHAFSRDHGCGVIVFTVSAMTGTAERRRRDRDQPLIDLAGDSGGLYSVLTSTRGYTLAKEIRNRIPSPPAASGGQQRPKSEAPRPTPVPSPSPAHSPGSGRQIWLLLAVVLASLLASGSFVRDSRFRSRRTRTPPGGEPQPVPGPLPMQKARAPVLERTQAWLTTRGGTSAGGTFAVSSDEPVILGGVQHAARSPAHLLIDDPLLAGEHCQIYFDCDDFHVSDLGTDHGTFVNQRKIEGATPLHDGDLLEIGQTALLFGRETPPGSVSALPGSAGAPPA